MTASRLAPLLITATFDPTQRAWAFLCPLCKLSQSVPSVDAPVTGRSATDPALVRMALHCERCQQAFDAVGRET